MMPGVPERRSHDYVRAGTTTLFAALEAATGKVIGSPHRRHRAIEFKKFLAELDKGVPAGLQVHLILDNHATHKTPEIKKWLLAHPRFHLHFTPTSASWLNLVERWFAELTQKKLKRGVHRSVQALERDIRAWLADWSGQPRPFLRTKTADEVLERVAAYCHRMVDRVGGARLYRRLSSVAAGVAAAVRAVGRRYRIACPPDPVLVATVQWLAGTANLATAVPKTWRRLPPVSAARARWPRASGSWETIWRSACGLSCAVDRSSARAIGPSAA
ncbi:transposase [Streptomyces sp. TE3672]